MATSLQEAKQLLQAWWNFEDGHEKDSMQTVIPLLDPEWNWKGFDPVNTLDSLEAYQARFRVPFRKAFPSLKREVHLMLGGFSNGRVDGAGDGELWVCGTGLFHGFLQREWLGIPAAEAPIRLRWADFHQIRDERILRSFMLVDLVDLLEQLGILLLPESLGKSGIYPTPKTHDGILTEPCDECQTAYTMKLIREFLFEGLNQLTNAICRVWESNIISEKMFSGMDRVGSAPVKGWASSRIFIRNPGWKRIRTARFKTSIP